MSVECGFKTFVTLFRHVSTDQLRKHSKVIKLMMK